MAELIHRFEYRILGQDGTTYTPSAYGELRADGTWEGWIEFRPSSGDDTVLRTERETSQPNRKALIYWASGLEPIYFEGAFTRALTTQKVHRIGQ